MKPNLLNQALLAVEELPGWNLADWDLLLRQADRAHLLSRLAVLLDAAGLVDSVPPGPRYHLQAALVLCAAQKRAVEREVEHIRTSLQGVVEGVILLKGAAYLAADLPAAKGRIFSDVDILVPHALTPAVEAALMLNGWISTHHHPYDQRYYRQWMHELPPMQHMRRETVIDVHHAIVPVTATRLKPSSDSIIAAARPVPGRPGLRVLAPTDMVLHSATHLFYNEEFSHGLRDLSDMDLLLRHFGGKPDFWPELLERARQLTLERPLYYCLRHALRVFGTPVPAEQLNALARAAPAPWAGRLMDELWQVALRSPHQSLAGLMDPLANGLLYLRAHRERMPLPLLIYHILHKAFRIKHDNKSDSPTV
ncbi:MAG: nucleotidyltransferase family protein [Rhodocyclaceae bacterium]|nr:nucleotidyltransferase family protein [Rhodocyclaceae bacterium]